MPGPIRWNPESFADGGDAGPVKMSGGFGDAPEGWDDEGAGGARPPPALSKAALFARDELDDAAPAAKGDDDETPIQRMERAEREKLHAVRSEVDELLDALLGE